MEDQVEIIKSNKGGLKVIHKGYMYTVHKKRQCGGIRWRCAQRSLHCKGSISTGMDGPPKVNMPHNHLPDLHSVALARGRQPDDFPPATQFLDVKFEEDPVLDKMADWSVPRKVRKSNFSTDEVDVLVDSVKSHYSILYGKYAKRATNRWIRQKAWLDILKKVNGVSVEKRTLQEVKNKWKKCQYALKEKVSRGSLADDPEESSWDDVAPTMRRKNRYNRHLYNAYDLDLKKSVVIFAEENGNKEAQARYGISEANIRRWRRLKNDIFGAPHDEYDRGKLRTRKRVNYNYKLEKVGGGDVVDPDNQSQSSSVDSMPLQERLSKVAAQEKIAAGAAGPLKSQPLSPTKLKVTRQSPKTARHVEPPPSPVNEEMCLRWNSHHSNMQTAFPNILSKEQYVDVTLAAEGKTLKCHRLILSSCSPYFEEILSGISPFQHPVLFMRDIPFWILKSLCDFMYAGEVHIFQNKLEELLTVAEALKIKGLAGKSTPPENQEDQSNKNDNNSNSNNNSTTSKEKKKPHPSEREKEKPQHHPPPPLKKNPIFTQSNNYESTSHDYDDDLLDPLDLLEPLYEEVAEEKKPSSTIVKPKENKYQYQPLKKPFTRRLRKRKYSDVKEPSPPPVFSFRKGTRSRPNVKIPKYYHSDYSNNAAKSTSNSQTDPLLEVDEIKTEPIDVEDNLINYSDEDHYMENSLDPVNCDSPIIITSTKPSVPQQDRFKKIKLSKPIITEVHTIDETNTTSGGLEVIKITVPQAQGSKVVTDTGDKKEERERGVGDPLQEVVATENVIEIPVEENEVEAPGEGNEVQAPVEENEVGAPVEGNMVEAPVVTMEIDAEDPPIEDAANLEPECVIEVEEPPEEVNSDRITEAVSENTVVVEEEQQPDSQDENPETVESVSSMEISAVETVDDISEEIHAETVDESNEQIEQETGNEIEEVAATTEETPLQDIRIEDVRTTCLEEVEEINEVHQQQMEEEMRATSLDHLEKEAMNVANAINLETQAGPPDIE